MLISIDQSYSGTGVCYMSSDGRMEHFLIKTTADMLWEDRIDYILSSLFSILDLSAVKMDKPSTVEHVIMEGYAFGGSFRGFQLGELGGAIKYAFHLKKYRVKQISISHHKMFVTHNGKAKKPEVIAALHTTFGIDVSNDNIADAISMALLYKTYLAFKKGTSEPLSIYNRILMSKVDSNLNGVKKSKKPRKQPKEPGVAGCPARRKAKTAKSTSAPVVQV